MRNKKGFTLVELLAVIVVLAIVMGIAAVSLTNVMDTTRKNAYVATAQQFINGTKDYVKVNDLSLGDNSDIPQCSSNENSTKIYLEKIKTEGGENDKSPYRKKIDKTSSFVQVTASAMDSDNSCTYSYAIFITDGTYRIGATDKPTAENELKASEVKAGS